MAFLSLLGSILFVGNSLIGPDLPQLVEAGLRRMEMPVPVAAQIINGAPLRLNWDEAATAEGVNGREVLQGGQVQALVLAEGVPVQAQIQYNDTRGAVVRWAKAAREARPEVQVYLLEGWHSLDSGAAAAPADDPNAGLNWRARLDADLPAWEGVVRGANADLGADAVRLIPAGQALAALSDAIDAGGVPGLSSVQDVFQDDIHPNGKGLYFLTMVQLAALTGTSPEGLPPMLTRSWPSRDAVIADDLAPVLQRIAWQVVSTYQPAPAPAPAPVAAPAAAPVAAVAKAVAAPAPQALPVGLTPITNPNLGMNLNAVNDWTVEQPFLDIMKTARPWVGHLPGQWGGWDHDRLAAEGWLDADGWPRGIPPALTGIATLILTDLPADAAGVAGRYELTWQGKAELTVSGLAQIVEAGDGRVVFDYAPGPGSVLITLDKIDAADPIHGLRVVRQDRAAVLDQGQIFNPDFVTRLTGVKLLRFMDWMATNNSALVTAEARPKPADYTWARLGVPIEVMVALANELQADAWFTLPHQADDGLVRSLAEGARDGLAPGLRAWVEYSNEVWNWQFGQAHWADEQAKARWGKSEAWVQFYALRAAEVADLWAKVFGAEGKDRLVRVISSQTGWPGLETQILDAPLVIGEGRPAPWKSFDAYAVTGYFGGSLGAEARAAVVRDWLAQSRDAAIKAAADQGLGGAEAEAFVAAHRFDLADRLALAELMDGSTTGDPTDSVTALLTETLPHHQSVARGKGLRLVMYEGGTHVVGQGPIIDDAELTEFFIHLNYSPQMGVLYAALMAGWASLSDAPFGAFADIYSPGKWGSWGALRHLGDDNPRWQALAKGCGGC